MLKSLVIALLASSTMPAHAEFEFDLVGTLKSYLDSEPGDIPRAVLDSAKQVVQVRSAGGTVVFEINTSDPQGSRAAADAFRQAGALSAADQVEFCQKASLHNCPIFENELSGSGFFAYNESTLLTSYHLLQPTIHNAFDNLPKNTDIKQLLGPISQQPIFVKVQNRAGKTLASNHLDPQSIRIEGMNPSILYMAADTPEVLQGDLEAELSDILTLNVRPPVSTSLKIARNLPNTGATVYAVGYNYSTKKVGRLGVLDVRPMPLLDAAAFDETIGITRSRSSSHDIALRSKFFILLDGPCKRGKSGGPILDAHGDVLGIIVGTYESTNVGRDFCYGINLTNVNSGYSLKNHWDEMNQRLLRNLDAPKTAPRKRKPRPPQPIQQ